MSTEPGSRPHNDTPDSAESSGTAAAGTARKSKLQSALWDVVSIVAVVVGVSLQATIGVQLWNRFVSPAPSDGEETYDFTADAGTDEQTSGTSDTSWPPPYQEPDVTAGGAPSAGAPSLTFPEGFAQNPGGIDPQQLRQLAELGVRVVDQAEINAYFSSDASFAAVAISGDQLANIEESVARNLANGVVYQPELLECTIKDVRLVEAPEAAGMVVDVDICERWQGRVLNFDGDVLETIPPTYAPQTMRLQFNDDGVMALGHLVRDFDDVCR